tara:strand:- start:374 stop:835 length:462 start_codon:yes stop_codon:yes gene_type:complete
LIDSITKQDSTYSTFPAWYLIDPYLSDSATVHYFLSFQSEDSTASAVHGFKDAQIAFINSIDDKVERVRNQQEDREFWSSPAVIQSLRSSTYLLMDIMYTSNENIIKKDDTNLFEYYIQMSLKKNKLIEELKKSTGNRLSSRQNFWIELNESL